MPIIYGVKSKDTQNKVAYNPAHINNLKGPIPLRYEVFVLLVSILSIVNIVLLWIPFVPQVEEVIVTMNLLLSLIFMGDFLYRIKKSKSKKYYILHDGGWIDFLGSLPFSSARIFRMFRIVKSVKIIKKFGFKNMMEEINQNRAQGALFIVFFLIILVLEFGSAYVVAAESRSPNANITTGGDALWWTFVTITTVGYGDQFPVTSIGRIVGVMVMITGVGLFGVLTGFLANTFVTPKEKPKESANPKEVEIKNQIATMKQSLEQLEKSLQK